MGGACGTTAVEAIVEVVDYKRRMIRYEFESCSSRVI